MASVALVGGDGSGKTTIATSFVQSGKVPCKYLYMGLSTLNSKPAFPTTLLIRHFKKRSIMKSIDSDESRPEQKSLMENYHHNPTKRSDLWHAIRSLNYLIDVLYRQIFSWVYQLRGYLVIYDRYYLFMTAPEYHDKQQVNRHWIDNSLYWIFDRLYPKPDLVVFLDAPPETLYARKPEGNLDYLEKRMIATIEQGRKMNNFFIIDASHPLDQVKIEFEQIILDTFAKHREDYQ
jgi:thymidylate kinase